MEELRNKESRSLYWASSIFVCLAAGIVIIGYLFYSNYEQKYRDRTIKNMKNTAAKLGLELTLTPVVSPEDEDFVSAASR